MEIVQYINHPEKMDRDTLYELRSTLALYPYFQTARLLMLQNLYLLHDPTFDQELRRAAIYITDRRVLFQMIEAAHYQLRSNKSHAETDAEPILTSEERDSRTLSLIDDFLDSLPKENEPVENRTKRKPTPADAAVDYVAYLMQSESDDDREAASQVPQLIGQQLIDSFINNDKGKIVLSETPILKPDLEMASDAGGNSGKEGYYTETLARIHIKQGNYSRALEIIQQLSLQDSKKSVYFADQIRFLQKLIKNSNIK